MIEEQFIRISGRPEAARILVVDDNEDAGETLTALLNANGFEVRYVAESTSAVQGARSFSPDLAILDLGLPVMDGYVLAEQLKTMSNGHLPLIALSGYGDRRDVARAQKAGFARHLTKPVHIAELLTVINELL